MANKEQEVCVCCSAPVSGAEIIYSNGVCPYCKCVTTHAGIDPTRHTRYQKRSRVMATRTEIRTQINPIWKFWLTTYKWNPKNEERHNDEN